jgi:nucleoside-diphosphate-sugar epimerase
MDNISCKISIIGAGWLGFPLAIALKSQGHQIQVTTTTEDKLLDLRTHGITPHLLTISPNTPKATHPIFDADIIIVTIPFKRNLLAPSEYKDQFQSILDSLPSKNSPWLIMTSSTSVYGDLTGTLTEETPIHPTTPRQHALRDTEILLQKTPSISASILRLGGLYGPSRQIGKFLSGKSNLLDATVNLIHLDDILNIISQLIEKKLKNQLFNLVSDQHPLKSTLYTQAAQKLGLNPPSFLNKPAHEKLISNQKIKDALNYQFQHPTPMED